MSHVHLSRELLEAADRGELPQGFLFDVLVQHLAARCPTCARALADWTAWRKVRGTPAATGSTVRTVAALLDRLPRELAAADRALRRAREDLRRLRRLPPEERIPAMERSRTRLRGPDLAELALEEARRHLPGAPREAFSWAAVAGHAVLWTPGVPFHRPGRTGLERRCWALQARAFAHAGNALRAQEGYAEAEASFERAWSALRYGGVTDLAAHAEVACLEASLHRARRRFAAADETLRMAATLYRVLGHRERLARAHLTQSTIYQAWGRPEEALEAAEAAEAALLRRAGRRRTGAQAEPPRPPEPDPRLLLMARHNRTDYLCDLGRFTEASGLLEANRHLYARFDDPWTQLRLAWVEGRVARGLGRAGAAEERLLTAREGFQREGAAYDVALVSLELAGLYLEQGRSAGVLELAREMAATFRRVGVHREAREAAELFARAAAQQEVTGRLLARLAHYLRQARYGPGIAFQKP
ncbi:MAG: hypothetical protein ACLF0P_07250 [Thermoanaerobaculia bacterium]